MRKELKQKLHSEELHFSTKGKALRHIVFGWNDGLVSTMALVAGLTGAVLQNSIIILAGIAEVFAGTISMALGTYISTKSQIEVYHAEIEREKAEIDEEPKKEEAEVRQFYKEKGFTEKEIVMIVNRLKNNKEAMLDVMIKEELGFARGMLEKPAESAMYMGIFYVVGGLIPLSSYLFFPANKAIIASLILTIIALVGVGVAKTKITGKNLIRSGVETLAIGLVATAGAYLIGKTVAGYMGVLS